MFDSIINRGYSPLYRFNETNYCPGCGRSHWIIGRLTAECAFCATAVPLQESTPGSPATIIERRGFHKPMLMVA